MLKLLLASIIIAFSTQNEPVNSLTTVSQTVKPTITIASTQGIKVWNDSSLLSVAPTPRKNPKFIAPILKANAALAIDNASATILYEKNAHTQLPIASITKLMTAIIILEEEDLNAVVNIGSNPPQTPGVVIWLAEGEKMTVGNLLKGLLIPSGNDAAVALAEYNAGSETNFVKKMNQKARDLGLKQTTFINATGLDEQKQNLSTAYELGIIAMYALKYPYLREITQVSQTEIYGENFGKHMLESTNKLLGKELQIIGLKTGKTDAAGPSFVSLSKTPLDTDLITVILNSEQRFTDTNILTYWIKRAYIW